jgi:putative redox protein
VSGAVERRVTVRRGAGYCHTVDARQHRFIVDEPLAVGGSDTGPTPLELLAGSLGACTAATVEMYAARKEWELGAVEVDVKLMLPGAGQPPEFALTVRLGGALSVDQLERLEQIARACPVRRALGADAVSERFERLE